MEAAAWGRDHIDRHLFAGSDRGGLLGQCGAEALLRECTRAQFEDERTHLRECPLGQLVKSSDLGASRVSVRSERHEVPLRRAHVHRHGEQGLADGVVQFACEPLSLDEGGLRLCLAVQQRVLDRHG